MLPLHTILARLLWAGFLGAAIGVERNIRRRPSGMRTGFCIALGAALFTIASIELARLTGDSSPTRIASNIVQGIGFLGAGAILRERGSVTGLTTAATIFATAAIGLAAGGGLYLVSGVGCAATLFALIALVHVENLFNLRSRYMLFRVTAASTTNLVAGIHRFFEDMKINLDNFQVNQSGDNVIVQFDADVSRHQQEKILAELVSHHASVEMYPVERQSG